MPKKIAGKFKKLKNQIGRESETKIFVPNSIHTRLGQENYEKNSKKIKKPYFDIIFSQNRMGWAGKERKILVPNSVHTRPGKKNFEKK